MIPCADTLNVMLKVFELYAEEHDFTSDPSKTKLMHFIIYQYYYFFEQLCLYHTYVCYYNLYAFYNKFLIILVLDLLLYVLNSSCTLIYLLYASFTFTCTSTCPPNYKICCKTWIKSTVTSLYMYMYRRVDV